jgi:enoyl-CoA hydratase
MDLILTGRGVQGEEALRMGLVNRLVPRGQAFDAAVRLAHELAAFPQRCLRSDRLSAYEQWSLSYEDALVTSFVAAWSSSGSAVTAARWSAWCRSPAKAGASARAAAVGG